MTKCLTTPIVAQVIAKVLNDAVCLQSWIIVIAKVLNDAVRLQSWIMTNLEYQLNGQHVGCTGSSSR